MHVRAPRQCIALPRLNFGLPSFSSPKGSALALLLGCQQACKLRPRMGHASALPEKCGLPLGVGRTQTLSRMHESNASLAHRRKS